MLISYQSCFLAQQECYHCVNDVVIRTIVIPVHCTGCGRKNDTPYANLLCFRSGCIYCYKIFTSYKEFYHKDLRSSQGSVVKALGFHSSQPWVQFQLVTIWVVGGWWHLQSCAANITAAVHRKSHSTMQVRPSLCNEECRILNGLILVKKRGHIYWEIHLGVWFVSAVLTVRCCYASEQLRNGWKIFVTFCWRTHFRCILLSFFFCL